MIRGHGVNLFSYWSKPSCQTLKDNFKLNAKKNSNSKLKGKNILETSQFVSNQTGNKAHINQLSLLLEESCYLAKKTAENCLNACAKMTSDKFDGVPLLARKTNENKMNNS